METNKVKAVKKNIWVKHCQMVCCETRVLWKIPFPNVRPCYLRPTLSAYLVAKHWELVLCRMTFSLEWRKWWPHSKLQTVRGHTHLSPLWAFMCLHIKHSWLLVRGLLCLLSAGHLSLALVPRNNAVGGVAGGRSYAFSDNSPTGSSGGSGLDVLWCAHLPARQRVK